MRNKARRMAGLKVGDPREADHKKPLSEGGGNGKGNIRVVSKGMNAKKEVEVTGADGKTTAYAAKHVILATGGHARQLHNLTIDGKNIIGYREAMSLQTQPKSMIVVGSGAIGVEFAYVYNSMGTQVTIVEFMPRIVPVEDEG